MDYFQGETFPNLSLDTNRCRTQPGSQCRCSIFKTAMSLMDRLTRVQRSHIRAFGALKSSVQRSVPYP